MRSCRDITALVSQGLDKKLSVGERLAIGLHVMMCSRCRNFQNQSQFIRKAAHGYIEQLQNRLVKKPESD
ncbi:MAG: zf-HC2 domain-containing protein [Methylomonas sp.]|nr:zf-HC2 domain-containing protein [Methylomonas sp.]